jgi:opacity protein-like surface antigen
MRASLLFAGSALSVGLLNPAGAWAQCTSTLPTISIPGGPTLDASSFIPLARGSSVNSIVSVLNTASTAFLTNTSAFVSAPAGPQPDQQGGGVWGRTIGGSVETKNTGVTSVDTSAFGFTTPGSVNCTATTRQDYAGFQVGHDISILNHGASGANWHFGVTAGYFESFARDTTTGGTFTGNFQVPFAGLYTAFTQGNLFLDGQARWDFYQNNISDSANGIFNQDFNARGFSLTGNAGYRIDLHSNWFVEPSAGVVWSKVSVDPLNVSGTLVLGTGLAPPGTVQIEDFDSVLGRASLRVGTNFTAGNVLWQPFFTASVFHEFAGDVTTKFATCFEALVFGPCGPTQLKATLSTDRVGTYGQFGLGTAAALTNTGWLGYARFDYRIGENIDGWSINAGLRYQFTPGPTGSIKDRAVPVAYSYNWTGPYIGLYAGRTWGDEDWRSVTFGTKVAPEFGGYLIGGQAGYNVQTGRIVVGVEADYGFANAHGGKSCPSAFFFTCEPDVDRLGALTGRLGYTWGRALFYGKAGWAFGEVEASAHLNPGSTLGVLATPASTRHWSNGWTAGGGMEFALTDRWSAKAEYMHYDLGKERYVVDNSGAGDVDATTKGDTVRVGVNLHFYPRAEPVRLK